MGKRILVCGGRSYADPNAVAWALDGIQAREGIACLIEGGADGADKLAWLYATHRNIPVHTFPAAWGRYGKAAGPMRNRMMIEFGKPDIVIAFPGGAGTADMVRQAKKAKLHVLEILPKEPPPHG